MKRFLIIIILLLFCNAVYGHTVYWYDNNIVTQTVCNNGDNITPPTSIGKYGYHFKEWKRLFRRIEYLESTGTQYIDTGVFLHKNYVRVELKDLVYSILPSGTCYVFCGANNLSSNKVLNNSIHNCSNVVQANIGESVNINLFGNNSSLETKYNISYEYSDNHYTVSMNGVSVEGRYSGTVQNLEASIYLYAFHEQGQTTWRSKIRLAGCKIYTDTNTLVRDFIPVLDDNDVPCMYDLVENKFYYNQGTGDFVAGPILQ